jgi:hypothetical protein
MDKGEDREAAAAAIHMAHADDLLLKHDGSLDNGFELVTGKYALAHHQTLWEKICQKALEHGCISYKKPTTGLHVHLSRSFFTQLDIGKFVCFINSELHREHIRKIAGRDSASYAALKKKTITSLGEGRYEAVNLTNHRTIEVRIFKGTLKASRVLASIEFCHALAHWVKTVSVAQCEDWGSFINYVRANRKEYKHLLSFILAHNLA